MPERLVREAVTMRLRMVVSTFAVVSLERLTLGSKFFERKLQNIRYDIDSKATIRRGSNSS
jgi:hypothetical protein